MDSDAQGPDRSSKVPSGALTQIEDWDPYYSGLDVARIEHMSRLPSVFDEYLDSGKGTVFELGCGGSPLLARAARGGWSVAGIDFSQPSLACLDNYLLQRDLAPGKFLLGDVFTADVAPVAESVDLLISAGFLEHFERPAPILRKWSAVLKKGGLVVSAIPNLLGVNAKVFAKYDPDFWRQHVVFDTAAMDKFHIDAGLQPVRRAAYVGAYDIHMLVPWEKIALRFKSAQLYRFFKLATYFGVGKPLSYLPLSPSRRFSPYILGVYSCPD